LSGLYTADEMSQMESISPAPVATPVEIAAPAPPDHDPVTGETGPRILAVPTNGDRKNWIGYGQAFIAAMQSAQTITELDEWATLNSNLLSEMSVASPRAHGSVVKALAVMAEKLAPEPPPTAVAETPRLPAKESFLLRKALVKKLADCQTMAQVEAWRTASQDGIASLQDEDRAGLAEWEATRLEQLQEVSEVVG
jgi:hypothetical protein